MWRSKFLGFLIAVLLWPLARSWRYRYFIYENGQLKRLNSKKDLPPARCFAVLHGQQLPLVAFSPYQKLAAMASRSKDGQIAATLLQLWGIKPLRGSSHKGGSEALSLAVDHLRDGGEVVLTVDGPRGPRGCCKRGIVEISRQSGVAIQTMVAIPRQAIRLGSWDGFLIPQFASEIAIIWGADFATVPEMSSEEIFAECAKIASHLKELEEVHPWN